jgi:general secretion pathway protein G
MTLLEIMIVVAILGLLATVVVSNLMNKFNNAKVQTTKIKINEVKSTINQYYTVVGEYPNNMQDLVSPPEGLSPFFDKVPQDAWGKDLVYKPSSNGDTFEVMSFGKDGQRGTKDDLK